MLFDPEFCTRVLDAQIVSGSFPAESSFSIDSRTLAKGDIFVALRGNKHDGHSFIADALKAGASGIVLEQEQRAVLESVDKNLLRNKLIVLVPNTRTALVSLARSWRQQFSYPVVGITGSVGKTSTRELIAQLLNHQGIAYVATHHNQNNELGIALTLLRMRKEHAVVLVEMGVSKRGEMAHLADIVRPTIGVVTAIGHSHMAGLGAVADIAAEKRDIFKYFKEDTIGVVNGDQAVLANVAYGHPVIKFGTKTTNQIQARKIRIDNGTLSFVMKLYHQKFPISYRRIMNVLSLICWRLQQLLICLICRGPILLRLFKSHLWFQVVLNSLRSKRVAA